MPKLYICLNEFFQKRHGRSILHVERAAINVTARSVEILRVFVGTRGRKHDIVTARRHFLFPRAKQRRAAAATAMFVIDIQQRAKRYFVPKHVVAHYSDGRAVGGYDIARSRSFFANYERDVCLSSANRNFSSALSALRIIIFPLRFVSVMPTLYKETV